MNQPNQHFSKSIFSKKETEQTTAQDQPNQPKSVQHKPTAATS